MQLSKHFTLEEMTRSMVAARKGIDNTPGAGEIKNLENVCYEILEPVRAHFDKPIMISSAIVARRFVKLSAAKKRRSMLREWRVILKLMGYPT